ncbi:MAG: hypothetical protein MJ231_00035 [bacterium]|nr:hypothetical protein [bacterium]
MKRKIITIIFILVLFTVVGCKFVVQNLVFSSISDKKFAKIIEKSFSLNNEDKLVGMQLEFQLSGIGYACYAESLYSPSASELLSDIYPDYRYSQILELKKHYRKGEGSSLLLLIGEKRIIPVYITPNNYNTSVSVNLNKTPKMGNCYQTKKNIVNLSINKKDKNTKLLIY